MTSLNLKPFSDFTVGGRGKGSSARNHGFVLCEFDSARKRNWVSIGRGRRASTRIVACSSSRNGGDVDGGSESGATSSEGETSPSSGTVSRAAEEAKRNISRNRARAQLKLRMEAAVKAEDYKEAARLRDALRSFEEKEPVLRLRRLLNEAIAEERFEEAAKYRDELKEILPHGPLKCSSDATTLGIRVQVRGIYVEDRSDPARDQYFFAYRLRITNNSDVAVQLLRRHWIITDANGETEHVRGTGVIGEQPVILPRTAFEYSSACTLCTPDGRMEGEFEMQYINTEGSRTFNVVIAPFLLLSLGGML